MGATINCERFTQDLFAILDEAFEHHYGIFLDEGTSLFQTLESISAEEASIPVGGRCATLAAQVAHVEFYLSVLERLTLGQEVGRVDWGEVWRTYQAVTPEGWVDLRSRLAETYRRVSSELHAIEDWNTENAVGGAMAIAVHTAYHLGEIRQALCCLR